MLWVPMNFYSIGYMRCNNEKEQTGYFAAFAVCLSAVMGIAMASNLITFFIFYELLTLASYPLVLHKRNAEVAELADAQASGACGSNIVWVQVPSSALFFYSKKETDTVSFFSVLMIQKTSDICISSM